MVRTDGNTELCLDECVVDQVSHVFERLPIVFTDTVTKMQLDPQNSYVELQLLVKWQKIESYIVIN